MGLATLLSLYPNQPGGTEYAGNRAGRSGRRKSQEWQVKGGLTRPTRADPGQIPGPHIADRHLTYAQAPPGTRRPFPGYGSHIILPLAGPGFPRLPKKAASYFSDRARPAPYKSGAGPYHTCIVQIHPNRQ